MAKKKYYAVVKGRMPGIYTSWPEAEAEVKGYGGARFKGFVSRQDAEKWLQDPKGTVKKKKKQGSRLASVLQEAVHGQTVIYTDGGAINNPGPGGYGVVIVPSGGKPQELSGGYRFTTNNRMELMACVKAIQALGGMADSVVLYSDSKYVVNGISKGWALSWRSRGWRKSDGQPAVNADLWAKLLTLIGDMNIRFSWVKGHAGNPLNERCDQLATENAARTDLPEDKGYKK